MIKPYMALAVQAGWCNVEDRKGIKDRVKHLGYLTDFFVAIANWELPIQLIAYPEGALQGWPCILVYPNEHVEYTKRIAIEVPGEETELLGEVAKRHNAYILAQAKTVEPKIIKDRHFNTAFLINPKGEVILKHYKLQIVPISNTTTPHDVWDAYTKKYGESLDAFFQVADTEIGRIGMTICMEGSYPEIARGLAMNGAEIIYRPSYPEPWVSIGWFEIQNRARALDNCCYVVAPNTGPKIDEPTLPSFPGGDSMIVDYRGQIISRAKYPNEAYACAKINIEELRDARERNNWGHWIPTLRTEQYRCIYEKPIYPKNLWIEKPRPGLEEVQEIHFESVRKFRERTEKRFKK